MNGDDHKARSWRSGFCALRHTAVSCATFTPGPGRMLLQSGRVAPQRWSYARKGPAGGLTCSVQTPRKPCVDQTWEVSKHFGFHCQTGGTTPSRKWQACEHHYTTWSFSQDCWMCKTGLCCQHSNFEPIVLYSRCVWFISCPQVVETMS